MKAVHFWGDYTNTGLRYKAYCGAVKGKRSNTGKKVTCKHCLKVMKEKGIK